MVDAIKKLSLYGIATGVAVLLIMSPPAIAARDAERMPRIGLLHPGSIAKSAGSAAFMQGLRDFGYVEGRNIAIVRRAANGKRDRLPDMAVDLVRQKVDIFVACCQPAVDAARKATSSIPIVVRVAANYVNQGLVKSLRRPGGNLTGLSSISSDYIGKQLELFKEAVPNLSRVAIFWHPPHRSHKFNVEKAKRAATSLGLTLIPIAVKDAAAFPAAFRQVKSAGFDGIFILRGSLFNSNRGLVAKLIAEAALPSMFGHRQEAKSGGLMAYEQDVADLARRAATFVHKILNGTDPAEMPIEQPAKYDFALNLKTAKALGIKFPPPILLRATKLIE